MKLKSWTRILLMLCGGGLIAVLFLPMWRIDLVAPQYPEGLMLLIYPSKLGGNVDIINGLNHYIGMKTLHVNDFIEFTVLPYFIIFFAVSFFLVATFGKRKLLNVLAFLFVLFGILAMYDFWRWEYNYGHNLDPNAAIIVPGMAYQPPLIGFKQLLNFGAYSIPDIGGWIFMAVGIILIFCVIIEWRSFSRSKIINTSVLFLFTLIMVSCNVGPEEFKLGTDNCYFCKMTISDSRFGAEILTKKGKIFKFDDMRCVVNYLNSKELPDANLKDIFAINFCNPHQLINIKKALLFKSDQFRSPMGGNVAAFDNMDSLKMVQTKYPGNVIEWKELKN